MTELLSLFSVSEQFAYFSFLLYAAFFCIAELSCKKMLFLRSGEREAKRKTQDWIDQTNIRRHTAPNDFWGIHKKKREKRLNEAGEARERGKKVKRHIKREGRKNMWHTDFAAVAARECPRPWTGMAAVWDGSEIEGQRRSFFTLAMSCRRWLVVNLFCSLHCLAFLPSRVSCSLEHGNMWFMLRKFVIRRSPPTFYLLSLLFHAIFCFSPLRPHQPPTTARILIVISLPRKVSWPD